MTSLRGWTTSVDERGQRHWHPPDELDKTLTPTQYKAAIKALGLSQHLAGDWLGIGRRTSQGYALGEYPVPEPVAKLLRLCVKLKLKPEDVK
jgi:hypothetical protein